MLGNIYYVLRDLSLHLAEQEIWNSYLHTNWTFNVVYV